MPTELQTVEAKIKADLFNEKYLTNIADWAKAQVHDYLEAHQGAAEAEVTTAVTVALPKLIGLLSALLPPFLRPFVTELETFVESKLAGLISLAYAEAEKVTESPG